MSASGDEYDPSNEPPMYASYGQVPAHLRELFTYEECVEIRLCPPIGEEREELPDEKTCVVCGSQFDRTYQNYAQWARQACCNRNCATTLRNWMAKHNFSDRAVFLASKYYRICMSERRRGPRRVGKKDSGHSMRELSEIDASELLVIRKTRKRSDKQRSDKQ